MRCLRGPLPGAAYPKGDQHHRNIPIPDIEFPLPHFRIKADSRAGGQALRLAGDHQVIAAKAAKRMVSSRANCLLAL